MPRTSFARRVAVIRSRVDVALEQPRDAAAYERPLAELRAEIERLASLVNDLFTLARADAEERAITRARGAARRDRARGRDHRGLDRRATRRRAARWTRRRRR